MRVWVELAAACVVAALLLLAVGAALDTAWERDSLGVGQSVNTPSPLWGRFLAVWTTLGGLAAAALAWGLSRVGRRFDERLATSWRSVPDRRWILYGCALAFLVPALLRRWLLHEMPLTDDEAAYRLAAQMLAQGRLVLPSHPLPEFFDNFVLVNDGRFSAGYFLGWPALMAPGVWLDATGWMNAAYSALTVPPLFFCLRRLVGSGWAKLGVLLFLGSPMLQIAAATELSHTSCTFALAWLSWWVLRSREERAPWWIHALVAAGFAGAFFIRPSSALGTGAPLLLFWLWGQRGRPARQRRQAWVAFAAPAVVAAGLFLAVNQARGGSPWRTGYAEARQYAREHRSRYVMTPSVLPADPVDRARYGLGLGGSAIVLLNADLFGWPLSLLFVLGGGPRAARRLFAASAVSNVVVHMVLARTVGIDTFAPMHFFETAWPLLLLTVLGVAALSASRREGSAVHEGISPAPLALLVASMAIAAAGFVPRRLGAIADIVRSIELPTQAVAQVGLERAVIFAPRPFVRYCRSEGSTGWVFHRPNNEPGLENDPLWVNDLGVERDLELMRYFPDRRGYVMAWGAQCGVGFLPLDRAAAERSDGAG